MSSFWVKTAGWISLLAFLNLTACSAGGPSFTSLKRLGPPIKPPKKRVKPARVVILKFKNPAQAESFAVVPDEYKNHRKGSTGGSYEYKSTAKNKTQTDDDNRAGSNEKGKGKGKGNDKNPDSPPKTTPPAEIAQAVTQTLVFKTERFEVVDTQIFLSEMKKVRTPGMDQAQAERLTAQRMGLDYVIYGELTHFEIAENRSYWKIPWWVLVLIASFFLNKKVRYATWYILIRLLLATPYNSAIWQAGPGWEDIELKIDINLDLRLVDPKTGKVAFARNSAVRRLEKAGGMQFVVFSKSEKLFITESNAGRLIRFSAQEAVRKLAGWFDRRAGI